jgi:hypothetical protein
MMRFVGVIMCVFSRLSRHVFLF